MTLIKDYQSGGVLVEDERLVFDETAVRGVTTYYVAYFAYLPQPNLTEANNSDVGIYSNIGHAAQLTVFSTGVPADANSIVVDFANGYALSTIERTITAFTELYVDYYAITSIHQKALDTILITIPEELESGQAYDPIRQVALPHYTKFGFASIDIWGQMPSAAGTILMRNSTTNYDTETLTISDTNESVLIEFGDPFKVTDIITFETADGHEVQGLDIRLYTF